MLDEIKKLERKLYLKYAAGIIVGILLIYLFAHRKGTFPAIIVISGSLLIFICLTGISSTFDMFYKLRGKIREQETGEEFKETYINWYPWLKKWGWILYVIITSIGLLLFATMHENDFGGTRFVWHSLIVGIIIGFIIFYTLKLINTNWTSNKNKSYEIGFYIILSATFLVVCLGPAINKEFAKGVATCTQYPMERILKKHRTDKGFIHVVIGGHSERFKPGWDIYHKLMPTDSVIILCVKKGALGYEYVETFRLLSE